MWKWTRMRCKPLYERQYFGFFLVPLVAVSCHSHDLVEVCHNWIPDMYPDTPNFWSRVSTYSPILRWPLTNMFKELKVSISAEPSQTLRSKTSSPPRIGQWNFSLVQTYVYAFLSDSVSSFYATRDWTITVTSGSAIS